MYFSVALKRKFAASVEVAGTKLHLETGSRSRHTHCYNTSLWGFPLVVWRNTGRGRFLWCVVVPGEVAVVAAGTTSPIPVSKLANMT